ncbi:MAG: HalX domain-containing protein [Halodesulfurarchaeum sp.]
MPRDQESNQDGGPSKSSGDEQSPPKSRRGDVQSPPKPGVAFVDPNRRRRERVAGRIGDRFRLLPFPTPEAARGGIDRSIAVVLVSCEFETEDLEGLLRYSTRASPHSEVGLMATDSADLLDVDVEYDVELISPVTWAELVATIDTMIRRAQYSATLQRYFQVTLTANNRRIASRASDLADDEEYQRLESEIGRLQGRLDELTEAMGPDDYRAIHRRLDRGQTDDVDNLPRSDPSIFGLPDECPNCGLRWGVWHGNQQRYGYERIAAFVWRCTDCDHVISNPDPNFRHITRR